MPSLFGVTIRPRPKGFKQAMVNASPFQDRRPLYQVVAEKLITAIERSEYPVGTELPSEARLCAQFSVSRNTVREAVRLIEQTGMVSRRQGVGTRVERNRIRHRYADTLETLSGLSQYVKQTRRKILGIDELTAARAGIALPGSPEARWCRLEALRYVEDERRPIAWTQVFLPATYGVVLSRLEGDDTLICHMVEARFGISTHAVQQEISAVEITGAVAKRLHVRPKSAGLAMLRQYCNEKGEAHEVTWSIHPTNRYTYTMRLVRSYGPLSRP